jgi:hypothetical protein
MAVVGAQADDVALVRDDVVELVLSEKSLTVEYPSPFSLRASIEIAR